MKKVKTPKHTVLVNEEAICLRILNSVTHALISTGRAHTYSSNKPFTLKAPDHLLLLHKTNLEGQPQLRKRTPVLWDCVL